MFWDCRRVIWMRADAMKGSGDLERWLAPFLARLGHKARRRMCPLYVEGLIGPGDRKSVEPMAARLAPGDYDQLHHFISDGVWDETPLEEELALHADRLVGGARAALVVDDTALPKKCSHSAGVAPQYASALGKTANCQTLVSLTLAQNEVPVMIGLRLFLPESWTGDADRLTEGGRARGGARGALQARDRAQRNRSRPCSRRSLRHGAGRRRIRSFRRLPTGAGRPQTHLGGRRSKTSEGLSRRRRTGLSGRRTWTPAQATYPGPALLVGGRDVGASEMASHQS